MNPRKKLYTAVLALVALAMLATLTASSVDSKSGIHLIRSADLQEWLGYLASDELEGRATFTEGLGLAAAYIAGELKAAGVQPGGDNGSYFQRVAVKGIKSTNRSSMTVTVNGESRTFKDGEGVTFPRNIGGKRSLTIEGVEFVGYGLNAPLANHNDYQGRDVKNRVVVYLGNTGPKGLEAQSYRRLLSSRARYAVDQEGAAATIAPVFQFGGRGAGAGPPASPGAGTPAAPGGQQAAAAGGPGAGGFQPGGQLERPDFTTAQRLDAPIPPSVTAQDELFEFLFSGSDINYAELQEKVSKQDPLPAFTLRNVKITFDLDASYEIIRTQYTRNVVGIVEGSDPALKNSYVTYGAHYDHVGYAEGEMRDTPNGPRRQGAVGRVKPGAEEDRVWNGADDDGSGSVVLMAVAKAFALGPKPRRSLLFVWHTGEERGLWGSRYNADYPGVELSQMVANINMDMVGRNRDDKEEEANTVYLVGGDRISTELHNISVEANESLPRPLTMDFEMNDPSDLEQIYYRSDHYSYAAKGIPVIFLTTGLHPDYHANTDSADRINYEKMTRIAQLAYETGRRVAELERPLVHDQKGPRAGKGFSGKIPLSK